MKLINLLILIVLFNTTVLLAQKKDIRLDFGFQVNLPERLFNSDIPIYNDKNGGVGFHFYPKWNYSDKISFGINMEFAAVTENYVTDAISTFSVISFAPTVNYYFTKWKVRPFVGFGAGIYHVIYYDKGINFGIRPLAGLSFYDYFNLSMEYSKFFGQTGISAESNFGNYYIAVKASFSIGIMRTKKQEQEK
jgi:hypothetical protein